MKIKGIIFDVDGTLADTESIHHQSFNQAFRDFDLDWHWDQQQYIRLLAISGGRERIRYFLEQDAKLRLVIKSPEKFCHKLHRHKSEIYRDKLSQSQICLRPGVKRLIEEALDKKICLGIATSSSKANLITLLRGTLGEQSLAWFSAVITNDIVVDKKPSPEVYQCALANLGISPDAGIAIEDTDNGNQAALAAGLTTVITTHPFTSGHKFSGASVVVDTLGEADQPVQLRSGNIFNKQYIDLELLDRLLTGKHLRDKPCEPLPDRRILAK